MFYNFVIFVVFCGVFVSLFSLYLDFLSLDGTLFFVSSAVVAISAHAYNLFFFLIF